MKTKEGYLRLRLTREIEIKTPILGWRPCSLQDEETGLIGAVLVFATREQAAGQYDSPTAKMTWTETKEPQAPY